MSRHSRRFPPGRGRFAAGLALAALLVSACGAGAGTGSDTRTGAKPAALGPVDRATGSPVRIGFINAEGGSAVSVPQVREAAEAVTRYANEHLGGIAGHPVELVTCNDLSDGASGIACANKFVQAGVVAVVQGLVTNEDPVDPVVAAGIPWIGSVNNPAHLVNDKVFVVNATDLALFGAFTREAVDKGYRRVLLVLPDQPVATQAVDKVLRPMLSKSGIRLDYTPVPLGAPDPSPQIAAGLAHDPDAVLLVGPTPFCGSAIPAVSTSTGGRLPLYVNDSCTTPEMIGRVPEGATSFTTYVPGAKGRESVLYESVLRTYSDGTDLSGSTSFGYFSLLGLIRAANSVQLPATVTAESIAIAMRKATDIPLPLVDGQSFSCDGTAVPGAPAVCSTAYLAATVRGEALTEPRAVDPAGLYDGLLGG